MKRLLFALGATLGFIAGSSAGRGPYRKVASATRALARRPELRRIVAVTVDGALHDAQSAAALKIEHVIDVVRDKAAQALHLTDRDDLDTYVDGMANILE